MEGISGAEESRACDSVGDSVGLRGLILLGIFLSGEGVVIGVRMGVSLTGGGVGCFRLDKTTSENVLTGFGGVFQIGDGFPEGVEEGERTGVIGWVVREELVVGAFV